MLLKDFQSVLSLSKKETIMGILDFLGLGNKTNDVQEYVQKGAIILDVRTPEELEKGTSKVQKYCLQVLNGNIETIKNGTNRLSLVAVQECEVRKLLPC